MLQTRHIGKYTELLVLFTKYGRKDFRLNLTPDELLHTGESDAVVEPNVSQRAKAFADALKKMGPTFIKFGQLLSTRPDIVPPEYIAELESLQDSIDPFSFADVERIVEEELKARTVMLNELNYLQEARNTDILRKNLEPFPEIYIPAVIHDLSSSRVLTTELVKGKKVSKLTPLALIEGNYAVLAEVLTRAYLRQICVDGFWHSDPHPGNVFIRDNEGAPQLVLLDFGMVSRISHEFQDEIIKLLLAISSNRGTEVADACIRMSEIGEGFNAVKFVREITAIVAAVHGVSAREINTGQLIFNVISIAGNNEVKVPSELAMLAKTLLHLDGITKKLDPKYDPQQVIRDYAEQLMTQKLRQKFDPRNFYPALLDLNQLVLDFPHRAREIIDLTAAGRLTFGLKLTQAEEFLAGMHKIANRITVGVIIAAIIVASALMMRTAPLLATVVAASAIGLYLVVSTILHDRKDQEKAKIKGR